MPNLPVPASSPLAALRQCLPWRAVGFVLLLLVGAMLAQPQAANAKSVTPFASQVQASPDHGHPGELPHLVAIAESGADAQRGTRLQAEGLPVPAMHAHSAGAACLFITAARDTRLQRAVAASRRYPQAPHLLLNPGHAPPLA